MVSFSIFFFLCWYFLLPICFQSIHPYFLEHFHHSCSKNLWSFQYLYHRGISVCRLFFSIWVWTSQVLCMSSNFACILDVLNRILRDLLKYYGECWYSCFSTQSASLGLGQKFWPPFCGFLFWCYFSFQSFCNANHACLTCVRPSDFPGLWRSSIS